MNNYLIVHTPSWRIEKSYASERLAKSAMTRKYSKKKDADNYEVMTREYYNDRNVEVTVINLLSGKPCRILRSDVGGCCDPSTERYHCM